jgi:hypothetical protein
MTEPSKQDDGFLRGVVSSHTSYSEGWRDVCARLLWAEAEVERLSMALDVLSKAVSHNEQGKLLARAESQAEQIERLTLELRAERARQQGLIAKWRNVAKILEEPPSDGFSRGQVLARTTCANELEAG